MIMLMLNKFRKHLLSACMVISVSGCVENVSSLEQEAKAYAQKLGYNVMGASCMNYDSDSDGYVSCTVSLQDLREPIGVECSSRYKILQSGCKLQKMAARK